MTKRYTDDDVTWLVREVQESMKNGNLNPNVHALYRHILAPFLPDPEDALIEKMRVAYQEAIKRSGHPDRGMRAILAIVKQEGLP